MTARLIEQGIPESSFVKESGHCMHPDFIKKSVDNSLERLNLATLDVLYL